jgi:predicted DNA-binding protein
MATKKTTKNKETARDKEMDVSITIKLPANLRREARIKSAQTGVALSFVVRRAIEAWVNE